MDDQEAAIVRLKHSLVNWREVIVLLHSILLWEKNWYPGAIFGGLTITISDYIVPIISATIFKPESWNGEKEKEFTNFCKSIIEYKLKLHITFTSFYNMRTHNSKMYYGSTIMGLLMMAWVGNAFNNLLLTYLLITMSLLFPGLMYHGILQKYCTIISNKLSHCSKLNSLITKKDQ